MTALSDPLPLQNRSRRVAKNLNLNRRGFPGSGLPPLFVREKNPNRNLDRYPNRKLMALGHEKLDVYRLAKLSRLGKHGYSVQEDSPTCLIDFDSDFGSDGTHFPQAVLF
jgi:hypothetical protein